MTQFDQRTHTQYNAGGNITIYQTSMLWLIVVLVLVALAILASVSYFTIVVPQTNRANATTTAQANIPSPQATLTATAREASSLYAQSTSAVPVINNPLKSQSPDLWVQSAHCTFTPQDYRITALDQGFEICFGPGTILTDFTFQVQMKILKGDRGGMVFRATPSQNSVDGYHFEINTTGRYSLFRVQNNAAHVLLSDDSPFLKTGFNQPNLLTAIVHNSTLIIFINKQYVGTVIDTTCTYGLIGLISFNQQQPTEVAFSNAEVWTAL